MFSRPVPLAVLCAAAQFVLTVLILKLGFAYAPPAALGAVKLTAFASTVVLPLLLAHVLGLWRVLGLEWRSIKPTPFFAASLVTAALFLAWGVRPHGSVAGAAAMQFVNAFGEELLFRGVIFALLLRQPKWQAILLNGVLFGAMHLIHGVMDGSWSAATHQAMVTAVAGLLFTAVRYETGSLWLAIALHMLLNLSMIFSNVEPTAGAAVLQAVERLANVVELGLTGWLLVRARRAESQLVSR